MRKDMVAVLWVAVAMLAVSLPAAANQLVTNGGFETGDFTGWTSTGSSSVSSSDTHSGQYAAQFGPAAQTSGISQSLTTVPGQRYTLTFWLQADSGMPNSFSVAFNGTTLGSGIGTSGYGKYSYTQTATDTSSSLTFQQDPGSSSSSLDDVSVTAVPEPASWALFAAGLGCIGIFLLRRKKTA